VNSIHIEPEEATHYLFLDSNANNAASRMREFLSHPFPAKTTPSQ